MENDTNAWRIESLFDLGEPVADWGDADLADMLRHVLAQAAPDGPTPMTIGELLGQPHAPIESLESLKRLAKVRRAQPESAVPPDLWRVVYFASIAGALRSGSRISDLSAAELSQGFKWTLARTWVGEPVRSLVEGAMRGLGA